MGWTGTALITGAGGGLGQAIALHLAGPGARLFLHHHRNADGAARTADLARELGSEASTHPADLSETTERDALMEQVEAGCDALHLLVNNAGIYPDKGLLDTSPELWDQVLQVNCTAVFHLTRRALPLLEEAASEATTNTRSKRGAEAEAATRASGGGSTGGSAGIHPPDSIPIPAAQVINLGDSGADRITARGHATPYHVSKLGVHVLTRSFARELGPRGIRVNMISPGFLENSLGDPVSPIPLGRQGAAADILGALDYLLSPAAAYVSGANIVVSGGWNL